jgi:hypothetical protein
MAAELRDAFIREVVDQVRAAEALAVSQLSEGAPSEDVIANALNALAHSLLVVLDGGTKLSDQGRRVWLTDSDGEVVAEGLHEWLPDTRSTP